MTIYAKDAVYECEFVIGERVYHKLHPWDDRVPGIVICIHVRDSGSCGYIEYGVVWKNGLTEQCHAEHELTRGDEAAD